MTVFSSFTYGSGIVYGAAFTPVPVEVIGRDLIRLDLSNFESVVDSAFLNASNYSIDVIDGDGQEIEIRDIIPPGDDVRVVDEVYIHVGYHVNGTTYRVRVSGLRYRHGGTINIEGYFFSRRTKLDASLSTIPAHYNKTPSSLLRHVMTAITREDEAIGGSRNDFYE